MAIGSLLGVIGGVLGYVALGVVLRLSGLLKPEDAKPLNTVLMYIALPALIFNTVHSEALDWGFVAIPALAWAIAMVGMLVAWAVTRVLKLPGPTAGAFILVAVFGNTAYIGYPVASALLGDAGLVRAIFYDLFGNTPAVITIGAIVASRLGQHEVRVNPLREVLTFPPLIALAAALALHSVPIPDQVSGWLEALGKIVVPLIMISVGLSLKPAKFKEHLTGVGAVAGIRLVLLPLLALALGSLVLGSEASVRIAVLEAGVPSMMLAMIIGLRFKLDVDFIASAILVTMIGAVLTIPLFQLLIG